MIGVMVPTSDAFTTNQIPSTSLGTIDIAGHHIIPPSGNNTSTFDSSGNLWVADSDNNRVVKYPVDNLGMYGYYTVVLGQYNLGTNVENNGGLSSFSLNTPNGLVFDSDGNLWVGDTGNSRILKYPAANLSTGGAATVVLGQSDLTSAAKGFTATTMTNATSITFDSSGNLWVADTGNSRILKYPAANLATGGAATVALGQSDLTSAAKGITATTMTNATSVDFDSDGNLWVADMGNSRILKYPAANLATGGAATVALGQSDLTSDEYGITATTMTNATSVDFDSDGNLWVADSNNSRILKYPAANLSTGGAATVALGQSGLTSKTTGNTATTLDMASGLTFDSSGNLWVGDTRNSRILKYPAANLATGGAATVALGQTDLTTKDHGNISSPYSHSAKTFHNPTDIAIDSTGNVWISEWNNHRVLKFDTSNLKIGGAATVVLGQTDFTSKTLGNTATTLRETAGIAFDSSGNLWVADAGGHRILKYPAANLATGGAATVALGQTDLTSMSTGNTATTVDTPEYITFDSDGNLWLSDRNNHRVLKYPTANLATGGAATVALGQSDLTSKTTGNTATTLDAPRGLTFDSSGDLWVADTGNSRILKYPAANLATGGAATVVLGQSDFTSKSSGTTATKFLDLRSLEFDSDGNLWVADKNNLRIVMFPAANLATGGAATLVLGQPDFTSKTSNTAANGGLASTTLDTVTGLAFDSSGDLWVVDDGNHRVMKYDNISGSQSTTTISTGANSITLDTFSTSFSSSNSITGNKVDVQSSTTNPTGNSTISGTPISNYFTVETNTPGLLSSRTVELTYTENEISSLDESTLQINRFSDGVWTVLTTAINSLTNTLTATTPGFSTFTISGFSPSSSSSSSGGGGNNCDLNGFGNNNSLRVYQVSYDIDTYQVLVQAYSTCGSISAKITTPTQQSILGLSTEQTLLDDRVAVYSGYLDESDEKFNISIQNKRDSFYETFYINDKSIIKKYTGNTGYTSQQQGSSLPTVTSEQPTIASEPSVEETVLVENEKQIVEKETVLVENEKQIVDEESPIGYTPEPTEEQTNEEGGGCLIATATYGSEMAPQVQQLRELRDNQLLNTESGTAFMGIFNDIYYSFSPVIADYERENPLFKEAVKLAITPMISSLSLMENAESESEVLSIGISVIALNLGMYLGVPAIVIVGIRKRF